MKCTEYQRTINRFVDHEIKATESAGMFEHLAQCAECRRFYDTLITLGAELDKIRPSIDEGAEPLWQPGVGAARRLSYHITDQKRIAPRPSTLAVVIVMMLVVSLLFSVNITIEKPAQIAPTAEMNQR